MKQSALNSVLSWLGLITPLAQVRVTVRFRSIAALGGVDSTVCNGSFADGRSMRMNANPYQW